MKTSQIKNLAEQTREDFPIISNYSKKENRLIYLDHAATSQKPKIVLKALNDYYSNYNANVHRGAHQLSREATKCFEEARAITAKFIQATSSKEIVFTRNATEAINLIAHSWGDSFLKENDEILITLMEHHSNIVPWQLLAKRTGCVINYIGINNHGELDLDDFYSKLSDRTRLVSVVHISNVLGSCNPIKEIVSEAKRKGAFVLLDACQSLAHQKINVKDLGIDFLAGSSHKLCGPTGIGFLWGQEKLLQQMPPFLGGGEMIHNVSLQNSTWADLPHKFEAGTPAIGEAIAMATAIKYLEDIGLENIQKWEKTLINHLFERLNTLNDIKILGPSPEYQSNRGALATFSFTNIHSNDIAELLDTKGICIRSGHHCCQPLHKYYGLVSTARASLNFTTTIEEIDFFIEELISSIKFIRSYL